jgi:glycoprotein endo-alpha-1,2-mannosidase
MSPSTRSCALGARVRRRHPSAAAARSIHRIGRSALFAILLALLVPAGAALASPLTVAAYYYPWYGSPGLTWEQGYTRGLLDPPEAPLLGEYASGDPAVIAQHFAWAQQYGVDVFVCSWVGPGTYADHTIRDELLPSPARGGTQIALLYESLQRLGIGADARIHIDDAAIGKLVSDFDYLARTYFSDPGYYRIDGRPVVVLYATRVYRGPVAEAIHAIRDHLETTYGVDPYLIGDEVSWTNAPDPARIRLFDAITGYTPYDKSQPAGWPTGTRYEEAVARRTEEFQAVAKAEHVAFVPDALPGFDDLGFRPAQAHHVLPRSVSPAADPASGFEVSLEETRGFVDPALDLVAVTSWNEWYEDSQIEPTAPAPPATGPVAVTGGYPFASYGFSLLEVLARFKLSWETSLRGSTATGL